MVMDAVTPHNTTRPGLSYLPRRLLAPIPLFFLQPALHRIINSIVRKKPEVFHRIGIHKNKRFLIDPLNMPFVLLLRPDPQQPFLRAYRRTESIQFDARIAGTILTLLDMIDGRLDGDALFFSRDLIVEGNTEAVVCLRNALDDMDGSIADDVVSVYGLPGRTFLALLRRIRRTTVIGQPDVTS
jgi:O2-independent ubiquinone biosynthesis accessory factor UbiT